MSFWIVIGLAAAFIIGGLYSFWKSRNIGLYTGPIDDRFLSYFEQGIEYTVIEMIKRVDEKTKGEVRLGHLSFTHWLNGCVRDGKLTKRIVERKTKKGLFQVEAYKLGTGKG